METIYANMFYYNGWESGKWEVLNGGTSYKFICGAKSGKKEMMWCVDDDRKQTKVPDEIKKCKEAYDLAIKSGLNIVPSEDDADGAVDLGKKKRVPKMDLVPRKKRKVYTGFYFGRKIYYIVRIQYVKDVYVDINSHNISTN